MFHRLNRNSIIEITSNVSDRLQQIKMSLKELDFSISLGKGDEPEQVTLPLRYQYIHNANNKNSKAKGYSLVWRDKDNTFSVSPSPQVQSFPGYFMTQRHYSGGEDAEDFGKLIINGDIERYDVVSTLSKIEPALEKITSLPKTGVGMIYCKIKGIDDMLPIVFLGDGIRRMVAIVLRVIISSGGVFLIDEIESGFHHSFYLEMWTSLTNLADKTNTQVFATTHNDDCLKAAYTAICDNKMNSRFMVHRLSKSEDEVKVKSFWGKELANAMEFGFDLR
jgi:hypothetical protein